MVDLFRDVVGAYLAAAALDYVDGSVPYYYMGDWSNPYSLGLVEGALRQSRADQEGLLVVGILGAMSVSSQMPSSFHQIQKCRNRNPFPSLPSPPRSR